MALQAWSREAPKAIDTADDGRQAHGDHGAFGTPATSEARPEDAQSRAAAYPAYLHHQLIRFKPEALGLSSFGVAKLPSWSKG